MRAGERSSDFCASGAPPQGRVAPRQPHLAVEWEPTAGVFWSNFRTLLYGPAPPAGWPQGPFFSDAWVQFKLPKKALFASMLWHFILFNINIPFWAWFISRPRPNQEYPRIEVTWSVPPQDLAAMIPPEYLSKKAKQPSPPGEEKKPLPPKGADAFHPRQTIISAPVRPTHPRQTLIQPDSPLEAPKILPALPNIVQWNQQALPARPKLTFKMSRLKRRQARRPLPEAAAPILPAEQRLAGDLNLAPSAVAIPRPKLKVTATAVARSDPRTAGNEVEPAPELGTNPMGGETGAKNIIALSATPAPPAPMLQVPAGNLSARMVISPEGAQPSVPGGSPNGVAGSSGGSGGGAGSPGGAGTGSHSGSGTGPPGIVITGGDPSKASPTSGLGGSGTADLRPNRPLPSAPRASRSVAPGTAANPDPIRIQPSPGFEALKPGAPPETILGPKRIYTMNVNAPNMASATGSWVLKFAELSEAARRKDGPLMGLRSDPETDLAGPVPLLKVDPKYPPVLVSARVEGDVILYAIIRKDGTVDSVQLVKGVDPRLDQNAMEALVRWKFRPAERRGEPVELEAVVTIPFRVPPRY